MQITKLRWLPFLLIQLISIGAFCQKNVVRIKIIDTQAKVTDTLYVQIWDNILAPITYGPYQLYKSSNINGVFKFEIPLAVQFARISLSKVKNSKSFLPFISQYLAEAGDSITINTGKIVPIHRFKTSSDSLMNELTLPDMVFSGEGASKYSCQYEFIRMAKQIDDSIIHSAGVNAVRLNDSLDYVKFNLQTPDDFRRSVVLYEYTQKAQKKIIDKYSTQLSLKIKDILKSDILGVEYALIYSEYSYKYLSVGKYTSIVVRDSIRRILKQIFVSSTDKIHHIADASLINSTRALNFLMLNSIALCDFNYDSAIIKIGLIYHGHLKDKLITSFFIANFPRIKNQESAFILAYQKVASPDCIKVLNEIQNNQSIGKKAYKFQLPDTKNNRVSLNDFRGKVVFIDFWYTGCPGCAAYFKKDVRSAEEYFRDSSNVVFVSICIDQNENTWKKSVATNSYTSDLSINLYTEGKGAGHPAISNYSVTSYPRPILVDKNGNIFSNQIGELRGRELFDPNGYPLIETINRALRN